MQPAITAVILAAGKGTRMKSARAKVLHEVFFQPMLNHVLRAVKEAGLDRCAVVIGHQREAVMRVLTGRDLVPVIQEEQNGTGHAVLCTESACATSDLVMILCGDTPLIRPETLRAMIEAHHNNQASLTLMTTLLDQPFGYGRILKNAQGEITGIVEEKDADDEQRRIQEVNAGIYLVERRFLFEALRKVGTANSQGEVYLTDIVAIANREGLVVRPFVHPQAMDVLGVNSRIELAQAQAALQQRHNRELMLSGITLLSPETTLIEPGCTIGRDCLIEPGVQIVAGSRLGEGCRVASGAVLVNCIVGDGASVGANSVLSNCTIPADAVIAPLTLRGPES